MKLEQSKEHFRKLAKEVIDFYVGENPFPDNPEKNLKLRNYIIRMTLFVWNITTVKKSSAVYKTLEIFLRHAEITDELPYDLVTFTADTKKESYPNDMQYFADAGITEKDNIFYVHTEKEAGKNALSEEQFKLAVKKELSGNAPLNVLKWYCDPQGRELFINFDNASAPTLPAYIYEDVFLSDFLDKFADFINDNALTIHIPEDAAEEVGKGVWAFGELCLSYENFIKYVAPLIKQNILNCESSAETMTLLAIAYAIGIMVLYAIEGNEEEQHECLRELVLQVTPEQYTGLALTLLEGKK